MHAAGGTCEPEDDAAAEDEADDGVGVEEVEDGGGLDAESLLNEQNQ